MKSPAATSRFRAVQRGLTIVAIIALFAQLIVPMLAFPGGALAQEATPTPTEETSEAAPADPTEPALAPTDVIAPDPTETVAPEPTDTVPPAPTDIVVPESTETVAPEPTDTPTEEAISAPNTEPTRTITGTPTIKSDLEDYPPGGLVTLTGTNWQPGEIVHIFVNDDWGSSWSRNVDVTADADGNISDVFNLPNWFVAEYKVKATGSTGSVASATFTDSRTVTTATINGGSTVTAGPGDSITAIVNVTTDSGGGNAKWQSTGWGISTTAPSTLTCVNHGNHDSTGTYSETFTITAPTSPGTYNAYFIAYNDNTCGGGPSNLLTLSSGVVVNLNTSTAVSRTAGTNPSTYGSTISFTATVTASTNPSGVGTVTFKNGATVLCNAVGLSGNTATCSPSLAVGSYSITAEYSGATGFNGSTSSAISHTVNPKSLTGSFTAANKIYDGATTASILTRSLSGVVGGDDVSLTGGTASFADKNVGTSKTVTGTGFTLGGTSAANYTLGTVNTTTADITAKTVTGSFTAADKIYDGNATATIVTRLITGGVVGSEVVTLTGGTASYNNKNVGSNKTVTGTGFALGGADSADYVLGTVATTTANITAKALTGTITANDKAYDGTAGATLSGSSLPGIIAPDVVTLVLGPASFANKNVGTNKIVTAALSLSGADAGNYSVNATATDLADITAATLTGSFTADNKVYDGNTSASIASRTLTGVVNSDTVSLTGGTATFADAAVGAGKTVTGTGFVLSGADAGNYGLASSTLTTTANITQRAVTVTVDGGQGKVYGELDPALTYQVTSGTVVNGDLFSGALEREAGETVGLYLISQGNLTLGANYALTFVGANFAITQRAVTVTADDQSKIYGEADPDFTYTPSGLVDSDTLSDVTCDVAAPHVNVGSYAITCAGNTNTNYNVSYVSGTLSNSARPVTVAAEATSKTYGDADPALTYQITSGSLVGTDDFSGELTRAAGENVGTYAIQQGTVALSNNYTLSYVGANLTIGTATLTVTAVDATKTYGDANPTFTGTIVGIKNGDDITATYDSAADETSAVGNYAIVPSLVDPDNKLGNYEVTSINGALMVTKAALTVTANDATKTYGDANPGFSVSYAGFANGDDAGDLGGTLSFATDADASSPVGDYPVTPSGLTSSNYAISFFDGTLSITKRLIQITADGKAKTYGASDPALTYSITSGNLVNGDLSSGVLSRAAGEDVGTYAIFQGTLTLSSNYDLTYAGADFEITQRAVTVTTDPQTKVYGDSDPLLTYQITAGSLAFDDEFTGALSRDAGEEVGAYAITQGDLELSANYDLTFVPGTLTIGQRAVTITADAKSKTYGDGDPALTSQITSGDLAFTDSFAGALTRVAGENVGTYAIEQGTVALNANYTLSFVGADLTITARAIEVTADGKAKTYGNADPALTSQITSGDLAFTDAFTGSLTRDAGEEVGSYAITQGTLALSGNYDLTFVPGTLTIGQRTVTGSFTAANKVYDGNTAATVLTRVLSGTVIDDDVALVGGTATFADKNVGNSKAVTLTGATLSGTDAGNYSLTGVATTTAAITAKELTVTGAVADNKTYDGDAGATVDFIDASLNGVVDGDSVTIDYSAYLAWFDSKDVGIARPVTVGGVALSGTAAGNYIVAQPSGLTAEITPLAITGSFAADDKTYDGTTAATVTTGSRSLSGVIGGDDVSLTGGTATFADKNVGDGKTVGLIGASLGGDDADNYWLTSVATCTANITPLGITGSFTASNKIYDGTTAATVLTRSLTGVVSGDTVSLTGGTATFNDKNVNTGKTVTLAGATLTGAQDSNYTLGSVATTTADITAKAASVTPDAKSKTYGDLDPPLTGTLSGFLAADGVTASYSRSAGETVIGGPYLISATLAPVEELSNYDITYNTAEFTITKALLTVTTNPASKTYGEANPSFSVSYAGFVNGDDETDLSGTLVFTTGATAASPVGDYLVTPSGLTSDDYVFSFVAGDLTITQATLTVTADDTSREYGEANPALTGTIEGIKNFDNITATYDSTADPTSSVAGSPYAIVPSLADPDSKLGNYAITSVNGELTITQAKLTVTADDKGKTYGDANPSFTASYSGFKNGELLGTSGVGGSPSLTTTATVSSAVGAYPITAAIGSLTTSGNYTFSFVSGTLTITKAVLDVNAVSKSKVYGADDPTPTWSYGGFVIGDTTGSVTITGDASCAIAAHSENTGTYTDAFTCAAGTLSAANYSFATGTLGTLTINQRPIEVTAAGKTKVYGDEDPALTYQLTGGTLVGTDSLNGSLTRVAGENVGTYAIQQGTVTAGGNYAVTYVEANLTITKATLTVTADDKSKIYGDANPDFTESYIGFVNGEALDTSGVTGAPSLNTIADAISGVGTYTITAANGSLASGNYAFSFVNGTLTVTKATLTVTADNKDKTYGDPNPTFTASYSGFVDGEAFGTSGVTGSPSLTTVADTTSGVGTYHITAAAGSLTSGNYSFSFVNGTLTVTKANLAVNADNKSKTYGDANPTSTWSYSGFVNGDTAGSVVISGTAACDIVGTAGPSVGTYANAITCASGTLSAANYSFATGALGTLTIGQRAVTITADSKSKTYGDADPALTYQITSGDLAFTDAFTGSLARDAGEEVGSYAITQGTLALSGNYDLTFVPGTLEITPKTLTGSFTAANKVYDGNTSATVLTRALSGVVGADVVSLTGGTASFATAIVGTGKTVTLTGASLAGADAGNYTLGIVNTTTANITAKTVTGGFTAADKTYDGNATATILSRLITGGVVGSEVVTLTGGTASYNNKNVGSNKTVTGAGFGLGGADSANYVLGTVATTKANITAKILTGAFTAANKTYDGATSATILTRSLSGVVGTEVVSLTGGTASFATANAGTGKTVTGTGFTLAGTDVANYSLASSTLITAANISQKTLTGSFTAANKVWDGNANATILTRSLTGVVGTDGVNLSGGVATFNNANVGTGKIVTGTGFSLTGAKASNYVLASTTLTTTASMFQKWTTSGFFQPVDMNSVANIVKAGSTVPLKFEVLLNGQKICDTSVVKGLSVVQTNLPGAMPSDLIEEVATGGTVLRCDNGQYIYNWSTKGLIAGKSYTVTITLQDGTTIHAYFKMK